MEEMDRIIDGLKEQEETRCDILDHKEVERKRAYDDLQQIRKDRSILEEAKKTLDKYKSINVGNGAKPPEGVLRRVSDGKEIDFDNDDKRLEHIVDLGTEGDKEFTDQLYEILAKDKGINVGNGAKHPEHIVDLGREEDDLEFYVTDSTGKEYDVQVIEDGNYLRFKISE